MVHNIAIVSASGSVLKVKGFLGHEPFCRIGQRRHQGGGPIQGYFTPSRSGQVEMQCILQEEDYDWPLWPRCTALIEPEIMEIL